MQKMNEGEPCVFAALRIFDPIIPVLPILPI